MVGFHHLSIAGIPRGLALPNFASNELYLINVDFWPSPALKVTKVIVGIGPCGVIYKDSSHSVNGSVYVANSGSNDVSVIDLNTNQVIKTVKAGTAPSALSRYRDIQNIYVANSGSNDVSIVHGDEHSILKTVKVGTAPSAIAFNDTNNMIYVANSGSNDVSIISEYSVINTVKVGTAPSAFACSHSKIYVANSGSDDVSIIDANSNQVIKTVKVGTAPSGIIAIDNFPAICVANSGSDDISVLNDNENYTIGDVIYTIHVEKPYCFTRTGDDIFLVGGPLNVHGIPSKLYSFTPKEIGGVDLSKPISRPIPSYTFSELGIKDWDLI